jgi:ABC-type lipoprotein export system ATPase subunit
MPYGDYASSVPGSIPSRTITAAIIVTHDDRIAHYADRIVRIVDGRVSDAGTSSA